MAKAQQRHEAPTVRGFLSQAPRAGRGVVAGQPQFPRLEDGVVGAPPCGSGQRKEPTGGPHSRGGTETAHGKCGLSLSRGVWLGAQPHSGAAHPRMVVMTRGGGAERRWGRRGRER